MSNALTVIHNKIWCFNGVFNVSNNIIFMCYYYVGHRQLAGVMIVSTLSQRNEEICVKLLP